MRLALILAALLAALTASAQTRITATITVTNTPGTNYSLTVNGDTRVWLANYSTTNILTTNTIQASASNLYFHIAGYPFSGPVIVAQPATNQVSLIGQASEAMSVSFASNWATVSYATQVVSSMMAVRVPISAEPAATNRTNIASLILSGINTYSSNSFDGTSVALANFASLTNGNMFTKTNTFPLLSLSSNTIPNLGNVVGTGVQWRSNLTLFWSVVSSNNATNTYKIAGP